MFYGKRFETLEELKDRIIEYIEFYNERRFQKRLEGDRIYKYNRYKQLDPDAIYGIKEQYESILAPNPNLILWEE